MVAYVINDMEVTDPAALEEYKKLSPATVAQYRPMSTAPLIANPSLR